MSKTSLFREPSDEECGNGSQTLRKSERKKSPLVRSEILGRFVSTLKTFGKYSRHITDNLIQLIQIEISEKPQTFYKF